VINMALYVHRFQGVNAAGDQFTYSWWSNSVRTLAAANGAAMTWNATLWNGATAGNGLKDHCNAGTAMQNVSTIQIEQTTGKQLARIDASQTIAGTNAANPLPADVALVVSLRTALPQRSGRGRFYLPQLSVADVTSTGKVGADAITDLMNNLLAAWTAYNTASDRPVLYGRTSRLLQNIVTWNIGDLFDTQRRRENKITEVRSQGTMP
jgi:hypothetical protein